MTTGRVKGTAPSMTPDLASIIKGVRAQLPGVEWEQLQVKWPADDDGLWFFKLPGRKYEVQIESSFGVCPFLVETGRHGERHVAKTVDDVVDTVVRWLRE
jgi:hypothetical protein